MSVIHTKGTKLKVRYKDTEFLGVLDCAVEVHDKMLLMILLEDTTDFHKGATVILPVSCIIEEFD